MILILLICLIYTIGYFTSKKLINEGVIIDIISGIIIVCIWGLIWGVVGLAIDGKCDTYDVTIKEYKLEQEVDGVFVCNDVYNKSLKFWDKDSKTGKEIDYNKKVLEYCKSTDNVILEQDLRFTNPIVEALWGCVSNKKYEIRAESFPTIECGDIK